jgi:predicted GH43/DUF377 family glycosyl hydrolase
MKFYVTVFCLMLFLVLSFSTSFAQLNWTKDPANPVMTGNLSTWNQNVDMPSVLYNSGSARYEMWFCGDPGILGQYYGRPYHIGYAFSYDCINWNIHNTPVLDTTTGKWDDLTVEAPMVIHENSTYKMWYAGWNMAEDSVGIGYATSPDGMIWTKHPSYIFGPGTAVWEAGYPYSCSVMPVTGGYKIWYAATDLNQSEFNIGYAFSDNGITWQRDTVNNPVLEVGSPGSWDDYAATAPFVHRIDSTYYMWYTGIKTDGNRSGGLAYSYDGIYWTKYDDPTTTSALYAESDPVLKLSPGQWDGSRVESGSVLIFGDTLHMWYDGWLSPAPPNQIQIGHATMPLDTLLKYVPPPVGIRDYNNSYISNGYFLSQNYPNPFNPTTNIEFSIPKSEFVTLKIYNILGEEVVTLVSEKLTAGTYKYDWDASSLASGVYLYRIQAGDYITSKKMVLLR